MKIFAVFTSLLLYHSNVDICSVLTFFSRVQKDVELDTLRENAKVRENQLASQSLAYRDAKEMLEEERQCRAQLEWQLLSSIKVFASFISKHL